MLEGKPVTCSTDPGRSATDAVPGKMLVQTTQSKGFMFASGSRAFQPPTGAARVVGAEVASFAPGGIFPRRFGFGGGPLIAKTFQYKCAHPHAKRATWQARKCAARAQL